MIKGLFKLISTILTFKIFFWVEPDAKKFLKGVSLTILFIILVSYIHAEYLSWSELSGDKTYLSISFIVKNFTIFLSFLFAFFYLKKGKTSKLQTSQKNKIEGEEKIYTEKNKEDYFDKFRGTQKLQSRTEMLLNKKNEKKK